MAVDYDLVIIGKSPAGIAAARQAAQWQARVALVEQPSASPDWTHLQVLQEAGRLLAQAKRAAAFGLTGLTEAPLGEAIAAWLMATRLGLESLQAVAGLEASGVEVIPGNGEFCRKPVPGFTVAGRILRSRAYLLAPGYELALPQIQGLQATGFLTPQTLGSAIAELQPATRLVILGTEPFGVELAQTLVRLGMRVTLVVDTPQILPMADPEIAHLVQSLLEASGVRLLTGMEVVQVRLIEGKKWVQAGNQAIEADEIVLATPLQPALDGLNLEAVQVQGRADKIVLNHRLQTTNRRIYACLSHPAQPQEAISQAAIAVQNALFWPRHRWRQEFVPRIVYTEPEMAQVGMREAEAIRQYGKDLFILRQPLANLAIAQTQGNLTGLVKLLVHRNGQILGAHLVGVQAREWVTTIALAMQQRQPIQIFSQLAFPDSSFAAGLGQLAMAWQEQKLRRNPHYQDLIAGLFNVWRSWSQHLKV